MQTNISIRKTNTDDLNTIRVIEETAFGHNVEANLVMDLLSDKTAEPLLSLLALDGDQPIGHILFTRVYLNSKEQPLMHILAPVAVMPTYQKKGVGSMLIAKGCEILKEMGSKLVFVLGYTEYYPRFGFQMNAQNLGYIPPHPIPTEYADCWMVKALQTNAFNELPKGDIKCSNTLNKKEYW